VPLTGRATSSTDEFLARAEPFLVARAVECSGLLSLSARAAGTGEPGPLRPGRPSPQPWPQAWAWVEDTAGEVVAVAAAGPRGVQLSSGPAEAGGALARALRSADVPLERAEGPAGILDGFASAWCRGRPLRPAPGMPIGVYVATHTVLPHGVSGRMRLAGPGDVALLDDWARAFVLEVDGVRVTTDLVSGRIAAGEVVVWEVDGDVVSMAAAVPHAGALSRVQLVYTPPELRGHGFASACVAALTARDLATPGFRCMLFTDLENPTTNRIYQAIGYRRVGTLASVSFEPEG